MRNECKKGKWARISYAAVSGMKETINFAPYLPAHMLNFFTLLYGLVRVNTYKNAHFVCRRMLERNWNLFACIKVGCAAFFKASAMGESMRNFRLYIVLYLVVWIQRTIRCNTRSCTTPFETHLPGGFEGHVRSYNNKRARHVFVYVYGDVNAYKMCTYGRGLQNQNSLWLGVLVWNC